VSKSTHELNRRDFIKTAGLTAGVLAMPAAVRAVRNAAKPADKPNVVFVLADQWRAQATGYAGDPNALTPNLDKLAAESVNLTNAVSGCPVCCPYRASLMTGKYPLSHGVFLNDLCLSAKETSLAEAFAAAGYDTAYIGKWHLDGHGRSSYIPPDRRQGFDYWKALECTHSYNRSFYYAGNGRTKLTWKGYDAIAQTRDACDYIGARASKKDSKPFLLVLSWGPPHNPYRTAPKKHRDLYKGKELKLRANVPAAVRARARRDLAGYYAHISALDECMGELVKAIARTGIADNTILVFTSDHGDMLGSQGMARKQKPWDESIMVPFLLRYPAALGKKQKAIDMPVNTPDIMPTLLGLAGVRIPRGVEGRDISGVLRGKEVLADDATLITCVSPFGEWYRGKGREFRGLRTRRYTYVRDLKGPWLLYDNQKDPCQMNNVVNKREFASLQKRLDDMLWRTLTAMGDDFMPGAKYIEKWGYKVDARGTVPYRN